MATKNYTLDDSKIVIDLDTITLLDKETDKKIGYIKYDDLCSLMGSCTTFLPSNCVCYNKIGTIERYVIEENPSNKSIIHRNEFGVDDRYTASFPYIYYIIQFNNDVFNKMSIFTSPVKISSVNDKIYPIWMWNSFDDGMVCLGKIPKAIKSVDKIDQMIKFFWSTRFNNELSDMNPFKKMNSGELVYNASKNHTTLRKCFES